MLQRMREIVATGKGVQLAYNQASKCGIQMYGLL